jgi:hypothetical protein
MRPSLFAAAVVLALSAPAWAQATPPTALRGTIERVAPDRQSLDLRTREGDEKTLRLLAGAKVARVVAASLADVKAGAYVGVAALPGGDDGALKALEVHIFPELLRGVGDGHRPFDLAPGSTMTNGAVSARVDEVDGSKIVVAYDGGQQTITVDKSTPIVAIEPGGLGDLTVGAAIVARGRAGEDGSFEAHSVGVGVGGVVPPM